MYLYIRRCIRNISIPSSMFPLHFYIFYLLLYSLYKEKGLRRKRLEKKKKDRENKMDVLSPSGSAIIYIRVSTSLQTDSDRFHRHHVSEDTQKSLCLDYCQRHSLSVKNIVSEVGSATSLDDRHLLKSALFELSPGDTLVFYNLSRLCRSVLDFLKLSTKLLNENKFLVSVKENLDFSTSQGRLFATLLASFAQFESEMTSSRVKDSMAYNKSQGKYQSRPPYGYSIHKETGHLERVESELSIVKSIFRMVDDKVTYKSIASSLNDEGFRTRPTNKQKDQGLPGNEWKHYGISNIVKNRHKYMHSDLGHQGPDSYELLYSS